MPTPTISSKVHLGYVVVTIGISILKSRVPSIFAMREQQWILVVEVHMQGGNC